MIVPQMIAGAGVLVHARREVMVWGSQKVEYGMIAIACCAAEKSSQKAYRALHQPIPGPPCKMPSMLLYTSKTNVSPTAGG